jgi:PAS domain S-box-containing protein
MSTNAQPLVVPLMLAVAIGIAVFATFRWRLRHIRPTAAPGSMLMMCGAFWMATNALELASSTLETALFWNIAQWLYMALLFTGLDKVLTRRRLIALAFPSLVCLIMALTNAYHGLFITNIRLITVENAVSLRSDPAIFAFIIYLYGYTLIAIGTYVLTRKLLRSPDFRWQGSLVLLAVTTIIAANVVDLSRRDPSPSFRYTPLALVIAIPVIIVTLIRARRADLVPVARGSVLQIIDDAVLALDMENRIIDLNPAAEKLIGRSLGDAIGSFLNVVSPVLAFELGLEFAGHGRNHEIKLQVGGETRIYDLRRSPLTDWKGQISGWVLVLRNITERVRAEEAQRLSAEHFRALTENASDIVVVVDSMGIITYASPALSRAFLFSLDEIIGKSALEFVHTDDHPLVAAALVEAFARPGTAAPLVARFKRSDGTWRRLECIATNLLDHPAVHGVVVNARDVTERAEAEEKLRQSEERYRLHFTNVNDVVFSYDRDLTLLSVTPSIERHLGIRPEEFIGKTILDLNILAPEYIERAAFEAVKILEGERVEGTVYEFVARDGTRKFAEINGSPIIQDGQVVASVNVARDITERMHFQARLRASLEEKEILLKEIHHRVKNNLQIISSLLQLQSSNIQDSAGQTLFHDSQNRIRSMALIHERLYQSHDLAHIEFAAYLRDLTGYLLASYRSQHGSVTLTVDADEIYLDIDTAVPCGLLVNELVSNALKHAFPDGRSGHVRVEMRQSQDEQCRLSVCDDGVGFDPGIIPQSTGSLGLQLVHSLARQIGGTVTFETATGTSAAVVFTTAKIVIDDYGSGYADARASATIAR